MKEMEPLNAIWEIKSSELWSWLDSREKQTCKFLPPQTCIFMFSHCIIKVLPGGKKQTCLDIHLWEEFIVGLQKKVESPRNWFRNIIYRPQEVLCVSPEIFSCIITGKSPFPPFLITLWFHLFLCFYLCSLLDFLFLPSGFCLLIIPTFSWFFIIYFCESLKIYFKSLTLFMCFSSLVTISLRVQKGYL